MGDGDCRSGGLWRGGALMLRRVVRGDLGRFLPIGKLVRTPRRVLVAAEASALCRRIGTVHRNE